ncbi:PQQ-binding-like beta-propeller repeat protein [Halorussus gelatinilyticus]|uniref:PQQ-binding-like beta-propeller repeat protein n=1 Tax=Halorussus gelatinilyticus TaxID=2937524 RepID=A0A8U0IFJ2_9EURY|nr:PQQ-binding-like beta-propeller repeat protein [Halorussus gelatinilyticus]UPV98981.1 PQQ-binding-like beta-propeller repeat protein [Halorussus gelatinilyticus]
MQRRQVLATLGSTAVAGCASLPSIQSSQADSSPTEPLPGESDESWAQFGRTAAHPGRNTDVTIDTPEIRWQTTLPAGVTVPAIVGETVFVSGGIFNDRNEDYAAGGVYAFDRETGNEKWKTALPALGGGFAGCPPTVYEGSIYVGDAGEHYFHALDARTGEKRWHLDLGGSVNEAIPVTNDRVCFVQQEAVIAVDTAGEERWRYTNDGHVFLAEPAIADGKVYVGSVYDQQNQSESEDNTLSLLAALDVETGDVRWTDQHGENFHSLVVDRDTLFASDTRAVYAVEATTGTKRWRHVIEDFGLGELAVGDKRVFVADGQELRALSREDGSEQWQFAVEEGYLRTTPVVIDGAVVVTSDHPQSPSTDATTYALDTETGKPRWTYKQPGNMGYSATAVGDALYLPVYRSSGNTGSTMTVLEAEQ